MGRNEPNASETEHYGPICIDTGPPVVDYAFIDYVNNTLCVIYRETHMQNAAQQINYSFDKGLLMVGDGMDVNGDGSVFSFQLDPAALERYLIYTMTIAESVTDAAGNPIPTAQRTLAINDDESDGMADVWEVFWFGDIWSSDSSTDRDADGILDAEEYFYASLNPDWGAKRWTLLSPIDSDSDHDGISDGYEIQKGLNPTDASDRDLDPDGNGLTNYEEYFNSAVAPVINNIAGQLTIECAPYQGPAPSLSQGSLPITWSLLSGPPGMEIDRISGEVYWPDPTANEIPYTVSVRAENVKGSNDQTWLLTVFPAQVTVYVNASTGDDESGDGSMERPWKSIEFALSEIQRSLSPLVTIRVSAGHYQEQITIPRSGIALEGGWNIGFSQRWNFSDNGVEPSSEYETIIEWQNTQNPSSVIVAGTDTSIDGFTITGGNATNGGGISGGDGITVSNCKIIGNSAEMGGGIYLEVTAIVTRCLFLNNSAQFGGGICTRDGDHWTLVISGCTFRGNSADTGGGICNINSSPCIENCLFVGNTSSGTQPGPAGGGGIANESSSSYIVNCTFYGNTACEYGGAIGNFVESMPFLINNILWGNEAGVSGNEIYNDPVK